MTHIEEKRLHNCPQHSNLNKKKSYLFQHLKLVIKKFAYLFTLCFFGWIMAIFWGYKLQCYLGKLQAKEQKVISQQKWTNKDTYPTGQPAGQPEYQNNLKEDQQGLGKVRESSRGSGRVWEGPGRAKKGPGGSWKGVLEGSWEGSGRFWEG